METGDLADVLAWRNHQDVRRYMYTSREITATEHADWFEKSKIDASRKLLIFELDQRPSGFINFKQLSDSSSAVWGFYLAPGVAKGTGSILGQVAMNFAFNSLQLEKVCAEVLAFNERSIRFHLRLGFNKEEVKPQCYFDGHGYHDVHCFGLHREKWVNYNEGGSNV